MSANSHDSWRDTLLLEIRDDLKALRSEMSQHVTTVARHDERLKSLEDSRKTVYTLLGGLFVTTMGAVAKLIFDALGG